MNTTAHRAIPAYMLLGVLMLVGLALIPLPGIDQTASLHQLGRASGWWVERALPWPPAFSPLSTGLLGLVVARAAMELLTHPGQDAFTRRLWTSIASGLFLGGTFAGGVALGLSLELSFDDLLVVTDKVVLAGLIAVSTTLTAAALWAISDLIKKSGLGSGALTLFFVWELARMGRFVLELGFALFQEGGPEPGISWMPLHIGLLPMGMICLALWRRTPGKLPARLMRNLSLRSPLDLLILPLVVGAVAGTVASDLAGMPQWLPQSPLYDQGLLARSLASILVIPAVAAWTQRQPGAPGHIGWGIAGLVLLVGTFAMLGFTLWWGGV